jgi:hypothetical protein
VKPALLLGVLAACSGPAQPAPGVETGPPEADPAVATTEDPRDIGSIVTVVNHITVGGTERVDNGVVQVDAAVRSCADELLPMADRPTEGHWLVVIDWSLNNGPKPNVDAAAERSLLPFSEPPHGLADCIAHRAPAPPPEEQAGYEALISIRTNGWTKLHGSADALDDPNRRLVTFAVLFSQAADGSWAPWDNGYVFKLEQEAFNCAFETSPVADRLPSTGWSTELVWENPEADEEGLTPLVGDRITVELYPYADPPVGFETCMRARAGAPEYGLTPDIRKVRATIEVATWAFVAEHSIAKMDQGFGAP